MTIGNSVAIVGAGVQGRRLAYMWSSRGNPVKLIDLNPSALESALVDIQKLKAKSVKENENSKTVVEARKKHGNGVIKTFSSLTEEGGGNVMGDAWLVVENVPEKLQAKRAIIKQLDELSNPTTIIASNSSSFTISEVIDGLDLKYPERCVNLHSYWPPETCAMEIMGSSITEPSIIPRLMTACEEHGFTPFHVKKNSTGYIYNRIWAAIKRESLLVAASGVATPREIDAIYKDVLKTPLGPFEQMDVVGLDVALAIEEHYVECRGELRGGSGEVEERIGSVNGNGTSNGNGSNGLGKGESGGKEGTEDLAAGRELLARMIAEGKLGVKSGEGFYKY